MNPYWTNGLTTLYRADARAIPLPDASVHCAVTSPPYYGLRRYKGQDERYLGAEATPEEYLENLLTCFRGVRRVLRSDGVLWVNLGDTRSGGRGRASAGSKEQTSVGALDVNPLRNDLSLYGIPERFALAMQADGWVWRDSIVWAKSSAMPESVGSTRWERCRVTKWDYAEENPELRRDKQPGRKFGVPEVIPCDGCAKCAGNDGWVLRRGSWRTTHSHEMIYMFVKGSGYYADGDAVKTAQAQSSIDRYRTPFHPSDGWVDANRTTPQGDRGYLASRGANRRSVWSDISSEQSRFGHYAVFPSDLPRICIQASTSEVGVCPTCGNQWARMVEPTPETQAVRDSVSAEAWYPRPGHDGYGKSNHGFTAGIRTVDWRPTCSCPEAPAVPATVLDPFGGMMTTCVAAQRLGRRSVGLELSKVYLRLAKERLTAITLPMVMGGTEALRHLPGKYAHGNSDTGHEDS